MPTDADITAMEIIVEVMELFVQITEIRGGETWVTSSTVCPLRYRPEWLGRLISIDSLR